MSFSFSVQDQVQSGGTTLALLLECRDYAWLWSWYSSWSPGQHKPYWVELKETWGAGQERMTQSGEGSTDKLPSHKTQVAHWLNMFLSKNTPSQSSTPTWFWSLEIIYELHQLWQFHLLSLFFCPSSDHVLVCAHMHRAYKEPRHRVREKFNKLHHAFLFPWVEFS